MSRKPVTRVTRKDVKDAALAGDLALHTLDRGLATVTGDGGDLRGFVNTAMYGAPTTHSDPKRKTKRQMQRKSRRANRGARR